MGTATNYKRTKERIPRRAIGNTVSELCAQMHCEMCTRIRERKLQNHSECTREATQSKSVPCLLKELVIGARRIGALVACVPCTQHNNTLAICQQRERIGRRTVIRVVGYKGATMHICAQHKPLLLRPLHYGGGLRLSPGNRVHLIRELVCTTKQYSSR